MSAEPLRLVSAALVAAAGGFAGVLPGEVPGGGLEPMDVSPGVIGFLVTLALVLACIPLFRSMTGKLRGVQHRPVPGDDGSEDGAGVPGAGSVAGDPQGPEGIIVPGARPAVDEGRSGAGAGTARGPDDAG